MKNTAAQPPLVLLGAGGHAKVVLSLLRAIGREVVGVCDPGLAAAGIEDWRGLPVLGGDEALERFSPTTHELANGIGQVAPGSNTPRARLFDALCARGFRFPALVHPAATVDATVSLAEGAQVMAGAVLQPDSRIGTNTIVNTCASLDHDCDIGAHVHIAPGAVLCGTVRVGDHSYIGASATIVQGVRVGAGAFVKAGSMLPRHLDAAARWPAAARP